LISSVEGELSIVLVLLSYAKEIAHDLLQPLLRWLWRRISLFHLHHEVMRVLIGLQSTPSTLYCSCLRVMTTLHHLHRYESRGLRFRLTGGCHRVLERRHLHLGEMLSPIAYVSKVGDITSDMISLVINGWRGSVMIHFGNLSLVVFLSELWRCILKIKGGHMDRVTWSLWHSSRLNFFHYGILSAVWSGVIR